MPDPTRKSLNVWEQLPVNMHQTNERKTIKFPLRRTQQTHTINRSIETISHSLLGLTQQDAAAAVSGRGVRGGAADALPAAGEEPELIRGGGRDAGPGDHRLLAPVVPKLPPRRAEDCAARNLRLGESRFCILASTWWAYCRIWIRSMRWMYFLFLFFQRQIGENQRVSLEY